MKDIFEVGALRGEIEAMVAGKFKEKFPYEKVDSALESINERYKNDEAYKIFSHLDVVLGNILMMVKNKKRILKYGAEQRRATEISKKDKSSRPTKRPKEKGYRNFVE